MPYDYREMRWQHRECVWPDALIEVLETAGRECGHTADEMVLLLVGYAMDGLCDVRRSDDVMEATLHLRLFVRQWLRHEFPEQWNRAVDWSVAVSGTELNEEAKPDRKEWWDE